MTEGDGHSGLGRTMYRWDYDVSALVHQLLREIPNISINTYSCHPFCGPKGNRQGWARRSLDVWGAPGRGHPAPRETLDSSLRYLWNLNHGPLIRHYILGHTIWVRGIGTYRWPYDDHSGMLRHLHVTYLPVPPIS